MKKIKFSYGIALMSLGLSMTIYGSEETLCKHDEIMIASCHLNESKNRILSFCASPDKKIIAYRFGTGSKIELDAYFSKKNPISRWVDIATYTTYLGFRVGEYAYIAGIPQEKFGARAFLEVTKNNKSIMERDCTDNSFGEKELSSEAIMEVEDAIVRDNLFTFPPEGNSK